MKNREYTFLLAVFCTITICNCSTLSRYHYHVGEHSGGFSKMKLGANVYQLRASTGKGSPQEKISEFLLRRCAQLTLEHGKRYFLISSESESNAHDAPYNKEVIIKLLDGKTQSSDAVINAVEVVKQTNDIADGKLSRKARATFDKMTKAK